MTTINREQLLGLAKAFRVAPVPVPEFGDGAVVYVREMSAAERDRFEDSLMVKKGEERVLNRDNLRARLCTITLCNEHGERMFADADIGAVGALQASIITRIFDAAQTINGMGAVEAENAGND